MVLVESSYGQTDILHAVQVTYQKKQSRDTLKIRDHQTASEEAQWCQLKKKGLAPFLKWIRNENSRKTVKTVDLALKLIYKIKVPVRPGRHYPRWNRIIFQGKPMRFRLDGRDWPNTRSHNGVLITVAP